METHSKAIGVGLDFGTTNSSLAFAYPDGRRELVRFPTSLGVTVSYRSLLYLERIRVSSRSTLRSWTGPSGVEHYLDAEEKGRLIQSLKSFLTSKSLRSTEVFGRQVLLEELIANILRDLRREAERQFGAPVRDIVVGRPVRFVGSDNEDDDLFAAARLEKSLRIAGFENIQFEFEPIGAACHYESTLTRDELILIGDFGGGTSDFSLLRVGPSLDHAPRTPAQRPVGQRRRGCCGRCV